MPGGALGGEALEPMDTWAFNHPKVIMDEAASPRTTDLLE